MAIKDCFKKMGKALSEKDKAAIVALIESGISEQDAVDKYIKVFQQELTSTLAGAPSVLKSGDGFYRVGDFQPAIDAAKRYMEKAKLKYTPPQMYAKVDEKLATAIAFEFAKMPHEPKNKEVRRAYKKMIEETLAQFETILETGLVVEPIEGADPYKQPIDAIMDVRENNHLYFFKTVDGFGSDPSFDPKNNPLMEPTKYTINGYNLVANDVFRVVHDYFGHVKHGVTFRAIGEENAWQSHASMYSPLARRAMTTETRGQNSWLNYGEHGKKNRTAKTKDTIFADQKIGLLPLWVSETNRISADARRERFERAFKTGETGFEGAIDKSGFVTLVHYSNADFSRTDTKKWGAGLSRNTRAERDRLESGIPRSYFGIESAIQNGYRKESGLGSIRYTTKLHGELIYDPVKDHEKLWRRGDIDQSEKNIRKAGYSGYYFSDPHVGKIVSVFDPLEVKKSKGKNPRVIQQLFQAQKNNLGLYSAVEKTILNMKLSSWDANKPANGKEIYSKLSKAAGVKKEELVQLDIETYLNSKEKFTRDEVAQFVRDNGIRIDEVIADKEKADGEEIFNDGWHSLEVVDDSENPVYRIDHSDFDFFIEGNDDRGWDVFYRGNHIDNASDIDEAKEMALQEARDKGLVSSGATKEEEIKLHEDRVEGRFENYREIKFTLPDIKEDFYKTSHFPDRNIVQFMRVTDRKIKPVVLKGEARDTLVPADKVTADMVSDPRYYMDDKGNYYDTGYTERGLLDSLIEKENEAAKKALPFKTAAIKLWKKIAKQQPEDVKKYMLDKLAFYENAAKPIGDQKTDAFHNFFVDMVSEVKAEFPATEFTDRNLAVLFAADTAWYNKDSEKNNAQFNRISFYKKLQDRAKLYKKHKQIMESFENKEVDFKINIEKNSREGFFDYEIIVDNKSVSFPYRTMRRSSIEGLPEDQLKKAIITNLTGNGFFANESNQYDFFNGKLYQFFPKKSSTGAKHFFIDEAQSDWHQEGREHGYKLGLSYDEIYQLRQKAEGLEGIKSFTAEVDQAMSEYLKTLRGYQLEYSEKKSRMFGLSAIAQSHKVGSRAGIFRFADLLNKKNVGDTPDMEYGFTEDATNFLKGFFEHSKLHEKYKKDIEEYNRIYKKVKAEVSRDSVPDAPLKNDAHLILALKRSLVHAAENNYTHLSWADSDMLVNRWNRKYEKLYRNVYDTNIPKYIKKIVSGLMGVDEKDVIITHHELNGQPKSDNGNSGFWTMEISDELKAKIIGEGFPVYQKDEQNKPRGALHLLETGQRILKLSYSKDESTIPHEFAHIFLEMEKQIEEEFGRSPDQDELLRWLGVSSFDEITTEHHEKFAETFEVYLQRGIAPSQDLIETFSKFRTWITDAYRNFGTDPRFRAQLTEESIKIFDKMLASEDEIDALKETPAFTPLFKNKEQAGMTDEEFEVYQKRPDKVKAKAQRTIDKKIVEELRKQKTKEWQSEKDDIVDEQVEHLTQTRAYQVQEILKTNPLQVDALREALGMEKLKRGDERFVVEKTDSLLTVAAKLGGLNETMFPDLIPSRSKVFGKPVFRKNSGMSQADFVKAARENGFDVTAETIIDLINEELGGQPVFSEAGKQELYVQEKKAETEDADRASLIERFVKRYGKDFGADPALVAETYGYESVEAMVNELTQLKPIKKQAEENAQAIMLAKHGDYLNDGTIEQEVQVAMENEAHAAMLLAEIRALGRKNKKPQQINRELMKSEAKKVIGTMKNSEIKPSKFYRAAMKAAMQIGEAKTDEEKMNLKIKQLANHYLYKEALEAKSGIERKMKYIRRMQKKTWTEKEVGGDYRRIISLFANMYDGSKDGKDVMSVLNWFQTQTQNEAQKFASILDHNLLKILEAKQEAEANLTEFDSSKYKFPRFESMTADEINSVYDQLRHLRFIGGKLAETAKAEAALLREEFIKSIEENGGKDYQDVKGIPTDKTKMNRALAHYYHMQSSLVNLLREIDNSFGKDFGMAHKLIYRELEKASNEKMRIHGEMYELVKEQLGHLSTLSLDRNKKVYELESGKQIKLGSEHRFMMALYWGTESSREAIRVGWGITDNDVMSILSTMSKEELDTVNQIWKINEHLWPRLSDVAIKIDGVSPPKLEPTPFVVNGIQMTGGHQRLFYDSADIEVKSDQEAGASAQSIMPTKAGSAHARKGSGGRPVMLSLENVTRGLDDVIHYVAYAEAGQRIRDIVNAPDVRAAIQKKHGDGFHKALVGLITSITVNKQSNREIEVVAKTLGYLRSAATARHLMYSVRNTVQNFSNLPIAMQEVGKEAYLKASLKFFDAEERNKTIQFITESSEFMKNRASLVNREAAENLNQLTLEKNKVSQMWRKFHEYGFAPQAIIDSAMSYPVWIAKYEQEMAKHGDHATAVSNSDMAVVESFGSGSALHMSGAFQSNNSEFMKSATAFGSWFSMYYQRMYRDTHGFTSFGSREALYTMVATPILTGVLASALVMDFPDDEEDEWWAWALESYIKFMGGTVVFLRDAVNYGMSGFAPVTPLTGAIQAVERGSKAVVEQLDPESERTAFKNASDIIKSIATVVPIPAAGNVTRTLDYLDSAAKGEEENTPILLRPYQAVVEGKNRN